jgi:hypothetical protein
VKTLFTRGPNVDRDSLLAINERARIANGSLKKFSLRNA